eukprot:TRINITY_DN4277_c0_g1_i1.p1 TRINITY_DN4277_c0_g1~~TRINITY_DN4277_c0_g1_i1.p1  ORF type:complete len:352 (-),score=49.88 TRINITY_DN4277_c0_g1_i1:736-1752(-)
MTRARLVCRHLPQLLSLLLLMLMLLAAPLALAESGVDARQELQTLGEAGCPADYYPAYKSTADVFKLWPADEPDQPSNWRDVQLRRFDWSDPDELALATRYKDCELPFKMFNVPEIDAVSSKWTNAYLSEAFDGPSASSRTMYVVSHSNSAKFMYHRVNAAPGTRLEIPVDYVPPTEVARGMTFDRWRELAEEARTAQWGTGDEHWYLEAAAPPPSANTPNFISEDLDLFSAHEANFWVPVPRRNKGIQCRFGMRGVQAASHFDQGRNFVAMLRGAKRYVLHPPSECQLLGIISERTHPSFRHSMLDWGDESVVSGMMSTARAIDTVVSTGEVLYIPR